MTNKPLNTNFLSQIVDLLQSARNKVVRTINQTMVTTYFEIGRKIVEEEQDGKKRAEYGKQIIIQLSQVLTSEFGKGFSVRNIEQMRQFYLVYSKAQTLSADFKEISQTSSAKSKKTNQQTLAVEFKLSWSHYLKLMRIDDGSERKFYEIEAAKNNWSVRELERQ
jgi:predicted nuclease of restriction endonuclease-like (RecB) superfamily